MIKTVLLVRPYTRLSVSEWTNEHREFLQHHLVRFSTMQRSFPDETILILAELEEYSTRHNSFIEGYIRVVQLGEKVGLVFYDSKLAPAASVESCYISHLFDALSAHESFLMSFLPRNPEDPHQSLACVSIHPFASSGLYSTGDLINDGVAHLRLDDGSLLAFPYEVKNPLFQRCG